MVIAALLSVSAHAYDLEVHVRVPGAEPVWAIVEDVEPNRVHRVEFAADRRTSYVLALDVQAGDEDYDWQVTFDLSARSDRDRRRGGEWRTIARPTMQSRTNELAQFAVGSLEPVGDPARKVNRFDGYQIEWIVRESAE